VTRRCLHLHRTMSKLQIKSPVPSDIEIAQSVDPVPVKQLADRLGILEDELDLYGKHKAKVHLSVLDRLKVRFCRQDANRW
jgi:hypothetical protein